MHKENMHQITSIMYVLSILTVVIPTRGYDKHLTGQEFHGVVNTNLGSSARFKYKYIKRMSKYLTIELLFCSQKGKLLNQSYLPCKIVRGTADCKVGKAFNADCKVCKYC